MKIRYPKIPVILAALLSLVGILSILLVPLIKDFYTDRRCVSEFTLKFVNSHEQRETLSSGTLLINLHRGEGSGTYSGYLRKRVGEKVRTDSVNRTFFFTLSARNDSLMTTTNRVSVFMNDHINDEDAAAFIYYGFRVGSTVRGLVMRVNDDTFATGENHYPKALCVPVAR